MKKILAFIIFMFLIVNCVYAGTDKCSEEYLKGKTHFSLTRYIAERAVKKEIKKVLKKQTGANFDVKFEGYTLTSIKKGIFKYIEITGENAVLEDITIPYANLKSITDYNYIDYTKNPVAFKSDMTYSYEIMLSDESINTALKDSDYKKVLDKVNNIAKPFFVITGVRTKIVNNKFYIITDYNFPIAIAKDRSFVAQSDFEVVKGVIKAKNVSIDTAYGNLGLNKVANLINYLNPIEFTIDELEKAGHKAIIENVNIVDNKVKIGGKIYIKGER